MLKKQSQTFCTAYLCVRFQCSCAFQVVSPKRAALAEANKRLDGANKKLTGIRAKVKELKDRVASLEDSLMKVSHRDHADISDKVYKISTFMQLCTAGPSILHTIES